MITVCKTLMPVHALQCVCLLVLLQCCYIVGDDIQKKRIVKAAKKDMDPVYTKLCDVIGVLAELADRHYLPDATLLQVLY